MASTRNLDQLNAIANACNANCDGLDSNGEILDQLTLLAEAGQLSGDGTIVVDSALNEESVAPVQNRVIAKLIPAEANSGNRLTDKAYVDTGLAGKADVDHTHDNSALETAIDNKVDKIEGKGLSTEDFTTAEKTRLASLHNYDDSELQSLVANKVEKVEGKQLSTNDFTDEEKEKLSSLEKCNETKYRKKLLASPYYCQGVQLGNTPGYLLNGGVPKKIVAIGNSLTGVPEQYTLDDGTQVDESREYGATYANNGWTNIVYTWLQDMFSEDTINFYKAFVRPWEDGAIGTRDYSLIANQDVYKVETERSYNTNMKLDDILDEDVDVIFLNAGENVQDCVPSNFSQLTTDFENLYKKLAEKCPNAKLYVFGLWWKFAPKARAIINAAVSQTTITLASGEYKKIPPIQVMYNPSWGGYIEQDTYNYAAINHVAGEKNYKVDGSEWGVFTEGASANHPNDLGFLTRAILAIYNLMWEQNFNQRRFCPANTSTIDNPINEILNFNTASIRTVEKIDEVFHELMLPPGIYSVALWYPYKNTDGSIKYSGGYVDISTSANIQLNYLAEFKPIAMDNVLALMQPLKMQRSWIKDINLVDCLS